LIQAVVVGDELDSQNEGGENATTQKTLQAWRTIMMLQSLLMNGMLWLALK
jgi:hypothetical protein